jgi:hypothetical protein
VNTETETNLPATNAEPPAASPVDEVSRVKIFLGILAFFLVVSVFTGGFHFAVWSMREAFSETLCDVSRRLPQSAVNGANGVEEAESGNRSIVPRLRVIPR